MNTYTYDSDGFKKVENVGGSLSTIIWDGPNYLQVRNQTSSTNKTFHTVESQMMSYIENTFRFDLLTDHLGSITAIVDGSQIRIFDTRYSAYGRNLWSTGTGCGFGWVGSYGYRETGLLKMSHYVRARHYSYVTGGWSTVDPLWPQESPYGYVNGRATTYVDPSGRGSDQCGKPLTPCTDILTGDLTDFPKDLLKCLLKAKGDWEAEKKCIQDYGKDLKGKAINNLLKYIACVVASEGSGGLKGGGKRFNPCSDRYSYGLACCHMEYLYCMMKCLKDKHNDVGLGRCLGDCYIKATKCATEWNEYGD